jgi:hypothetical protein
MLFGKYNHVVETFATDTADYSFRVRILPGRVGSGDHFFDPHSSYPPLKIVSIDRIPVSDLKVTEGRSRDCKENDADDVSCVIGKESLPRLGGRLGRLYPVFCDG